MSNNRRNVNAEYANFEVVEFIENVLDGCGTLHGEMLSKTYHCKDKYADDNKSVFSLLLSQTRVTMTPYV